MSRARTPGGVSGDGMPEDGPRPAPPAAGAKAAAPAPAPAYAVGQFRDAAGEVERLRQQGAVLARVEDDAFRELGFPDRGVGVDVGCGPGFVAARFRATRPELRLYGVDLDRAALAMARAQGNVPAAASASALALPFATGSLDFAYARLVMRYLPDPGAALRELLRVVRPGAPAFVLDSDDGALVLEPEPDGWRAVLDARHASQRRRRAEPLFARKLPGLMAGVGFAAVTGRTLTVSTLAVGAPLFARLALGPAAEAIDPDLMPLADVKAAAAAIERWAATPNAFGMTTVVLVAGRKPAAA